MDQMKISKSSLDNKDSPKDQYTTTVVSDYKKAPPLQSVYSTKNVASGISTMRPGQKDSIN